MDDKVSVVMMGEKKSWYSVLYTPMEKNERGISPTSFKEISGSLKVKKTHFSWHADKLCKR